MFDKLLKATEKVGFLSKKEDIKEMGEQPTALVVNKYDQNDGSDEEEVVAASGANASEQKENDLLNTNTPIESVLIKEGIDVQFQKFVDKAKKLGDDYGTYEMDRDLNKFGRSKHKLSKENQTKLKRMKNKWNKASESVIAKRMKMRESKINEISGKKIDQADIEMKKLWKTKEYRADQVNALTISDEYLPSIKISDNQAGSTNFMLITPREFAAIKNILVNGVAEPEADNV